MSDTKLIQKTLNEAWDTKKLAKATLGALGLGVIPIVGRFLLVASVFLAFGLCVKLVGWRTKYGRIDPSASDDLRLARTWIRTSINILIVWCGLIAGLGYLITHGHL